MNLSFFNRKYNVLVLGANGMLGQCLMSFLRKHSIEKYGYINIVHGLDFPEIDLGLRDSIEQYLSKSIHYDYIVNCAAITNTVGIEGNLKDKSYLINALAVKWISKACRLYKSKLIHISTDYVFSENTTSIVVSEASSNSHFDLHRSDGDEFPINSYGMHKLIGELFIKTELPLSMYTTLRVSWLYGLPGNKSFVHKFLKNCINKLNAVEDITDDVVIDVPCTDDEYSYPTSCDELCNRILLVMKNNIHGTINACDYPINDMSLAIENCGVSRYDFAVAILNAAKEHIPELDYINVVRQHMTQNSSGMRYPKFSVMTKTLCDNATDHQKIYMHSSDWEYALHAFINDNIESIKKWLYDGTKFGK